MREIEDVGDWTRDLRAAVPVLKTEPKKPARGPKKRECPKKLLLCPARSGSRLSSGCHLPGVSVRCSHLPLQPSPRHSLGAQHWRAAKEGIYLPRLQTTTVRLDAIRAGLALLTWEQNAFAYGERYDGSTARYRGFHFDMQAYYQSGRRPPAGAA